MSGRGYNHHSHRGRGRGQGRGNGRGRGRGRGRGGGRGEGRGGYNNRGRGRGSGSGQKKYDGGYPQNNNFHQRHDSTHGQNHPHSEYRSNSRTASGPSGSRYDSSSSAVNNRNTQNTNGAKGAAVHTVSEEDRIKYTKMLIDFRENSTLEVLEMPSSLTNTERKFIHTLSMQLGLKSKSLGKGAERHITVRKIKKGAGSQVNDKSRMELFDDELPRLKIGIEGREELDRMVLHYPPTSIEVAESIETGSSLTGDENVMLSTLQEINDINRAPPSFQKNRNNEQHYRHRRVPVDQEQRIYNHHQAQKRKLSHKNHGSMLAARKKLPAYGFRDEILKTIRNNRITILSGETGCGKSTQVPQFLIDDPEIGPTCNIVVTQPRRISAISIAERVAAERCEEVGRTVGYNIRLESACSDATQLVFMTPGVLLRKLQSSPELSEFNFLVIDEVHERDKFTEFLLVALRHLLEHRNDLHLILMSATIQTNELREYWTSAGYSVFDASSDEKMINSQNLGMSLGEVSIPGRTFPVQEFFLEDILTLTGFVDDSKFQSGDNEMKNFEAELLTLLETKQKRPFESDDDSSGNNSKKKKVSHRNAHTTESSSLRCIMCNQSGFKCPEELGSHVALCDGGGNCNMLELENKVRRVEVTSNNEGIKTDVSSETGIDDIQDEKFEYIDQNGNEDHIQYNEKWDGESPFAVSDNTTSVTSATLTEDEMLNRYQVIHDDEQIDNELLLQTMRYINNSSYGDGAILVFLPGWQEISEMKMLLEDSVPFCDKTKFSIMPLHSGVPSKDQRKVFQKSTGGIRKIVLATNIAETSVTIDDVAFVVDTGRAKEKSYDPHLKTSTLQPVWVSQASVKQRKGRAGRTKPGVCFHLFSKRRYASLRPFLESELLRTSLEEICLSCKRLNLAPGGPGDNNGIPAFLSAALTPPHPKAITNAIELLVDLGAMEPETHDLTQLGHSLSMLSLEPSVGKMVIWSNLLGCSGAVSSIAVAMSYKSPFALPPPSQRQYAEEARIEIGDGSESDQVTVLNVLMACDEIQYGGRRNKNGFYNYCRKNFISPNTISMVSDLRRNISRELMSLGFPDPSRNGMHNCNGNGPNLSFLQAAIAAGLYPNVATRRFGEINFTTMDNRKAKIHVSSVNAIKGQPLSSKCRASKGEVEFIVYGEMVRGISSFTMNQTTHLCSAIPLLLLCGRFNVRPARSEHGDCDELVLSIDDWIQFKCDKNIASSLSILRRRLDRLFLKFVANPSEGFDALSNEEKNAVSTLNIVIKSAFNESPGRC